MIAGPWPDRSNAIGVPSVDMTVLMVFPSTVICLQALSTEGPEQGNSCSCQLVNRPGKVSCFHTALLWTIFCFPLACRNIVLPWPGGHGWCLGRDHRNGQEHEQHTDGLDACNALAQHEDRKPDRGRRVEGGKNGGDIETTALSCEHEKDITDGIQDSCEHHQGHSCHRRQQRPAPQSHHQEQHSDGSATRCGQRPEGGGGMHPADKDEEAAKATPSQHSQPDSLWRFCSALWACDQPNRKPRKHEAPQLQQCGQPCCERAKEDVPRWRPYG